MLNFAKSIEGPKFGKVQKGIWLTVINEIFKFPPRLGLFCQVKYLFELSSGYANFLIQKWYIWAERDFVNYRNP